MASGRFAFAVAAVAACAAGALPVAAVASSRATTAAPDASALARAASPPAAQLTERVASTGVYAVRLTITTTAVRRDSVEVAIGSLSRRVTTGADGRAFVTGWFGGGVMNNTSTGPANVSVAGGILTLTLSSTSVGALISTNPAGGANPGFQMTYGYIEARILFAGQGSTCDDWPAFWTDGQSWPTDGEIDIAEGLGTLTSNYHSNAGANNSNTIPGNWCGSWHTYGVDREPGTNTIYWDGQPIRSYASNDNGSPQYIILNIGSGQGTDAPGTTMQVDYVHAWTH
jgi:hypothetical protein